MTRGYICAASADYIRQAHCLALSLQKTGNPGLAVIVESAVDVPPHMVHDFSHVLVAGRTARETWGKFGLSALFYELSPFDETICLDADMLFLEKDPNWAPLAAQQVTWATAVTYEGRPVSRVCRRAMDDIGLPDLYVAYLYFQKGPVAERFFKLVRSIFRDWKTWRENFKPPYRFNLEASTDVVMALAAMVTMVRPTWHPQFVHYRPELQQPVEEFVEGGKLYVDKIRQTLPFHYYHKDWAETKPELWRS